MAQRKPGPSQLTFTLAASGLSSVTYAIDVDQTFQVEDFVREEWLNSRISSAMDETTYAKPIIQTNAVNAPIQVGIEGCGFSNSVPVGPETTTTLTNALQRKNVKRYTIQGADSSPTAISNLYPVLIDHVQRMDQFNAYKASLGQNIPYQMLLGYRNQNFEYLTSTGLTVSGLDISESNCLIESFDSGTTYFTPATSTARTKGWSMVLLVISFQSSYVGY